MKIVGVLEFIGNEAINKCTKFDVEIEKIILSLK